MIIELEINGAHLIISGDNLTVNVTDGCEGMINTVAETPNGLVGIDALKAWISAVRGRSGKLAQALGVTHAAIPQWREVPADKLVSVERATGIKRQVLRPDLFEGMQPTERA